MHNLYQQLFLRAMILCFISSARQNAGLARTNFLALFTFVRYCWLAERVRLPPELSLTNNIHCPSSPPLLLILHHPSLSPFLLSPPPSFSSKNIFIIHAFIKILTNAFSFVWLCSRILSRKKMCRKLKTIQLKEEKNRRTGKKFYNRIA